MIQSELDRALAELYISNQKLAYQLLERQIISPEQLDTIDLLQKWRWGAKSRSKEEQL
jgi:hypothetical protein